IAMLAGGGALVSGFCMLGPALFLSLVTLHIKIIYLIEYTERHKIKNIDSHAKASRIKLIE
ncbi:MAG: hypothetical protein ACJ70U_02320, partial [Nitrososphaera sp.]